MSTGSQRLCLIRGGGPGELNQGVSNGGIIVGQDHVLVIDSLGAPIHAKNYIAAIPSFPFFPKMEIVAHEYCRKEMLAMTFPSPTWGKRDGWAKGGEPRRIVPPTTVINDRATYY